MFVRTTLPGGCSGCWSQRAASPTRRCCILLECFQPWCRLLEMQLTVNGVEDGDLDKPIVLMCLYMYMSFSRSRSDLTQQRNHCAVQQGNSLSSSTRKLLYAPQRLHNYSLVP